MKRFINASIALALGLGLTLALLRLLSRPPLVRADLKKRHVATTGTDSLGAITPNPCTAPITPCRTVQHAVDEAASGDEILVATGFYTCNGDPQVVYVDKTIAIRGGYTTTNWTTPYPITQPTTLDAEGQGRVVYISGTVTAKLEGLRITNGLISGDGGGIYATGARPFIRDCQIFSNTATTYGGGAYIKDSVIATLIDNKVYSNTRQGLYFSNSVTASLTNNEVYSSTLAGLYFSSSPAATLTSNEIHNNTWGGVFLVTSDNATLAGNQIYSNTTKTGGGVYVSNSDSITLTQNEIYNNTAYLDYGGGVYVSSSDNATLTDNAVYSNTAGSEGGGVYVFDSDNAKLTSNQVYSNTANRGGGICLSGSPTATLMANEVYSNTAGLEGGGVYLISSQDATLMNNMVVDNRLTGSISDGAGIFTRGSDAHLLHTTFARNRGGHGQGAYVMGGTLQMTNTILVSHTVGIEVDDIIGGAATLTYTLWGTGTWANGDDWQVGIGSIVTGTLASNWWEEPGFVDPDGGDYHLSQGAAAINRGMDAGVTTDIDGQPRDAAPDLGADEFTRRPIYLPLVLKRYQ